MDVIGIGYILKEARLKKDVSIEEVEEELKIRGRYLKALEEDNYELLPGKVYIKGFVKIYGEYLNLDVAELLEELEADLAEQVEEIPVIEEDSVLKKMQANKFKMQKSHLILAAIAIILIVLLIIIPNLTKMIQGDSDPNLAETIPLEEETEGLVDDPIINDQEEIPNDDLSLKVEIIDVGPGVEECWVQIFSDGEKAFEGILKEGQTNLVKAEENIVITLGNAGVAEITLGNKKIGVLGNVSEVVRDYEFTKEDL